MILNEMDLFLLEHIYKSALKKHDTTTWDLAKMYDWGKDNGDRYTMAHKSTMMSYRLKRMSKEGIVIIDRDVRGKCKYVLEGKKVVYTKRRFNGKEKPCVEVCDNMGKWTIFQI